MDKRRLTLMLDVLTAAAILWMLIQLPIPSTPRDPAHFWRYRREILRTLASVLWLMGLWLDMYPAWDGAGRVGMMTALLVAGQAFCVALTPYMTDLIIESYMGRFSQQLYGLTMLGTAAFGWLIQRSLKRDDPDDAMHAAACDRCGKTLLVAMGVMLVGLIVAYGKLRQAMWYSVALAAVWLLGASVAAALSKKPA
ncbi:MAG: hypothetical protein IJ646_00180 [Clostridia bacterium]|nr:hypothetical protein [Clostridia bacterium]